MAEKKKYTYAGMFKGNTDEVAVGYLEGWVTRETELRHTNGEGKAVANANIALNNATKNLAYALGVDSLPESTDGTLFVRVTGWEHVADRMAKAVKKGNLVGFSGILKLEEFEGKKQLVLTASDFKVAYYANSNNASSNSSASNTASTDPFANDGKPIDISDDDLPF